MKLFTKQRDLRSFVCCVDDFETNASRYEPHELLYTLRAYGHLNYVPPNSSSFFGEVEKILMSKFSEFDPTSMLEMLVSFVYIERFPINFLGHIFSPHFLMQIKGQYLITYACVIFTLQVHFIYHILQYNVFWHVSMQAVE